MNVWRTYYYLPLYYILLNQNNIYTTSRGSDLMVVGSTTTYAISAYHHWSCEFEPRSWQSVFDTTLCDKACQWLTTGWCFSPVSSINKTDCHDITEILLKVALHHNPNHVCRFVDWIFELFWQCDILFFFNFIILLWINKLQSIIYTWIFIIISNS
jgi:hypothetical protein